MSTPRNAPCPCGSGRKYRHCCMAADRRAAQGELSPSLRQAAASASYWEVDLAPFAIVLEEDPAARPAAALVSGGGALLYVDIVPRPSGEPEEVASELESAILEAAREIGVLPPAVHVRHAEVAAALSRLLDQRDIGVATAAELPELDEAGSALHAQLAKTDVWPVAPFPQTWAGWGLPDAAVADLFGAAAAFYRAGPWRELASDEALEAAFPGGRVWTVSVLGQAGGPPGLGLYSAAEDFEAALREEDPADAYRRLTGRIVSLHLEERGELPRAMQREVASAGWEVAAPDAYPILIALNTPGGGISRRDAADLTALLAAVPRFARIPAPRRPGPHDRPWTDQGSRLELRLSPLAFVAADDTADAWRSRGNGEEAVAGPPWLTNDVADVLRERLGEHGLRELIELGARIQRRKEAEDAPVRELGGLTRRQARELLEDDWNGEGPLRFGQDLSRTDLAGSRLLANVAIFLETLRDEGPLAHTKAGNLPRSFVTLMLDRLDWGESLLAEMLKRPGTRANEEDAWPLHVLRVLLELAGLIRKYRRRFQITKKGEALLDEGRAAELYTLLFRTFFRTLNLDYIDGAPEEPNLQRMVPLILRRIAHVADEWRTPEGLADLVLPPAAEPAGPRRGVAIQSQTGGSAGGAGSEEARTQAWHREWRFNHRVVGPLVDFGLLEKRALPPRSRWDTPFEVRKSPLYDTFLQFRY